MQTLQQLCETVLTRNPEQQAVEFEGRWYNWGQLAYVAGRVSSLLGESGVDAAAAVTFVPRNRPSALLALLSQGRNIRMLYAFQSAASIARQVERQMPAVVVVAEQDFSPELRAVLQEKGIAGIALEEMDARASPVCGAIMRGGFKALPETIESALLQHPAVATASVVGIPDERVSEVPGAAVQIKAGIDTPTVEELQQHLRERVLSTHIPVHWLFVDTLPKTPSFKVDRPAVRRLFVEGQQV